MRILAIETSCDDTAIALVEIRGNLLSKSRSASWRIKILKNLVSSQIKLHRPYGGVVPMLAKREHEKNLPKILNQIKSASRRIKLKIDEIAVTVGPGLEPALWSGITFAKDLAKKFNKPLIGANHLEGHLYSFLLSQKVSSSKFKVQSSKLFPAIALIVSGGHTILVLMKSLIQWKKLGETRDDAVGEAFDKVARMLNLSYPGGPELEKLAKRGNPKAINFPRPMLKDKNYDFSFSGLKTAVLYYLRDNPRFLPADVAASFQQAAIDVLAGKTLNAIKEFGAESVLIAGGVAANKKLREIMKLETKKLELNFFAPPAKLNTDNAAMIAVAAYFQKLRKKNHRLEAQSNLNL
ncbi:MAG: tRNA (adenosine(37)-N6)-threonylcarbamoyltransferase complex transferase subunit TsaD [Candidatus Harrisonbacteria bacterium RIFCSPLOWO2_02_FULL_41_13b]|uniref:tRNA N6-adenosine threonylcarbamoyltransferase n=1 Tax=Candidatus Harrisonbacteria bacterium RIFCSPLOWO2_02_FULL_41_13b TaxID=1798409 RepID=A0A1G1ZQI4_9BACT|nr:MAG: tRNA (adenosine(37)-N6)-threonylcarbamoyltransferase complex transferase subunit TsaD [Candidatus Harrisonbacteria bacterium RIFCSPHIGHO2_02_FULL_40_20]OGY66953.1 MAG: tRNA (adenosine(37)-N6)-threonylcarbamoyltransferase complex transferase subunit TsaD [Candidatus Harrisonbacteria bacterium RIFCSPLOWO2_02_FULL_41_13b]